MNKIAIGYQALIEQLCLRVLPHYRQSWVTEQGRGGMEEKYGREIHIYPKTYALDNPSDLLANLEFALKHEGMNLEIIRALFQHLQTAQLVEYIQKQPTSIYSRKIWFLYEFLTEEKLPLKDSQRIKYVDLLDSKHYFTTEGIKSPRHRVNDNFLGCAEFCPLVRRTEKIAEYLKMNLDDKAKRLLEKYDPLLIARTCQYIYTKETMSSYQIEHEQPTKSRILRFIEILKTLSDPDNDFFSKQNLIQLQNEIVDPRFKDTDYRSSQNYVGENVRFDRQIIDYISPKPEDVADLMQGIFTSHRKMSVCKVHPVIIAATLSFGFVFVHPFEDGNGRIHRFLIHDILSKNEFTPPDLIFPISAVMLKDEKGYNKILEIFSKPLLSVLRNYHLTNEGVMTVNQESRSYYQYIDFTRMAEYLFSCIEEAIEHHLVDEIQFLARYDQAKAAIQEVIDMPDKQIDLFIKFVIQNNGKLAVSKRKRFFPMLTDKEIETIVSIVKNA